MGEFVDVSLEAGVLTVTMARPDKKNAITNAMYGAMADALARAETDPAIRVVLFQGNGDSFTAGNDLADFAAVSKGASGERHVTRFLANLAAATRPLVAAVQGNAVGVGTTMLLHCDLVYLASNARLITPFVNLALVPEAGSTYLLPQRIGYARAYAMFALGEPMDAETAVSIGLANAVVPPDELRAKARAAAEALAKRPSGSLQHTKALMRDTAGITAQIARESKIFQERLMSAEAREAFAAFAERRPPDFSKVAG
ncbi:enoyl-CoA hydratase-related protein [Bradyrhizobium erythrophlei]|uniref:enoyl-CoA hydratase-related protein n=1 Tax=Bradyrhizobium erythrophlei TaxID=1437360 RepID=UPI0035E56D21